MKKTLTIIALVVVIGGLAWLLGSKASQPEIDPAGWQTYRNEELGFEFEYPVGWTQKEITPNKLWSSSGVVGGEEYSLLVNVGSGYSDANYTNLDQVKSLLFERDVPDSNVLERNIISETETVVAGVPAFQQQTLSQFTDFSRANAATYFLKSGKILSVSLSGESGDLQAVKTLNDQILSTFRFLD